MYAARRSGMKRELFGYVEGGYGRVLAALNRHVAARGVTVRCGSPVYEVRQAEGAVVIRGPRGEEAYDQAVLTVPAGRIAEMVPGLTGEEQARLRAITYQGIVCASMLLSRPLGSSYITNITEPGIPFTAVIEATALVDPAAFGGQSLVYLPRYLSQDSAFWDRSDDDIRGTFLAGVTRMYPHFSPADVRAFRIARAREVLALPTLHYSETLLPPTRTSVPGVFVVNSAQIASGTLNLNETVSLAARKARELRPLLRSRVAAGVS
jgi:protoporphyrinogen oxidase